MKLLFVCCLSALILSCNSNPKYAKAENAQDAGREFIRASLDGDYKRARFYLLGDADNLRLIETQERNYEEMTVKEKSEYKDASIRPINIQPENDSVTIYSYYQTSTPSDTTTLKVVKHNGEWLVDLKSIVKQ